MCRAGGSCFVLAGAVSVPMEIGVEMASVSGELGRDQLLSGVPVGRGCSLRPAWWGMEPELSGHAPVCTGAVTLTQQDATAG